MKNSKRGFSKERYSKPLYLVFCEGETEEAYIEYLKTEHKETCRLKSHISGSNISIEYINTVKMHFKIEAGAKDVLMYDADNLALLKAIQAINNVELLLANPCIELWFLLHFQNLSKSITSSKCIKLLETAKGSTYKKGMLDRALLQKLRSEHIEATKRAKSLDFPKNPSTNNWLFLSLISKKSLGN